MGDEIDLEVLLYIPLIIFLLLYFLHSFDAFSDAIEGLSFSTAIYAIY